MPKSEGALKIRVKMTNGKFLAHQVFILECAAEEFVFNISENGISSNKDEPLLKGTDQVGSPDADNRYR